VQDALRDASAGRAGLALITGGAGVGKTRLITELARTAQSQGAIVGFSRCFGTSARATLAPVADWLRTPAVRVATTELEPLWRGEIDRLLPAGEGPQPQDAANRAMVDGWQRHRFFEGLARGLLGVRRPTLLVIDNVQWCDEETLAFVGFLLALAPRAPLLVAGTLRDDAPDQSSEVAGWVARMRSARVLSEHALGPLDAASTASLAEAVAGHPLPASDVDLLHATTGGFPLFVVEAARTAAELGTQQLPMGDLTEVLRNRLAQATEVAREVAGLAAAVGTNFSLDLLTEASDLPPEQVVNAVDELWRRRILREYRDGYDFSHDLVRDAAYAQVSPPRRWLLHRRIAQGLELLYADESEVVAAQLADQYQRGGRGERAVVYYRRAAELSAAVFAHNEAIRMLSAAASIIETWPAGGTRDRQQLAVLEAMAAPTNARYGYSSTRLQEVVERCVALAEKLGNREALLNALAGLWASRFVQGRTVDGYRVGQRALELVGPDSDRSAQAHFAVGGSALSLGRLAEAVHHLELTARLGSGAMSLVGTRPDVHSTSWLAHALWLLGEEDRAFACSREAIRLARDMDHAYNLAVALAYCAVTDQVRGDVDGVRVAVAELTDLCERHGFAYYSEWAVVLDGWSMPDGAGVATIRRGIDALKRGRSFARMPYWLALLADAQAREGAAESAQLTLDAALSAGRAQDDLWWLPEVMRLRAAYDDGPAAASRLREAAELAADQGSVVLHRRCEQDLAGLTTRT
jgi:tetratricopeptide (TPR) repeat protein